MILEELELIQKKAMTMLYWIDIDGSKLCGHFRGSGKVKAFLSKEIRAVVLQRCENGLVVTRIRHSLGIDDYDRSAIIYYIVVL